MCVSAYAFMHTNTSAYRSRRDEITDGCETPNVGAGN